jgi:hypothetical protein
MKIYVSNIPLTNITKNMHELSQYIVDHNGIDILELHSLDYGLHIIEKNKIYRFEPDFNPQYEIIRGFKGYDLLIDKSVPKLLPVLSQLPTKYIMSKIKIYEYKSNKKSNIKLVIKCIKTPLQIKSLSTNTNEEPIDFYFEYENSNSNIDLTDRFFQDELNMFLSQLN